VAEAGYGAVVAKPVQPQSLFDAICVCQGRANRTERRL